MSTDYVLYDNKKNKEKHAWKFKTMSSPIVTKAICAFLTIICKSNELK